MLEEKTTEDLTGTKSRVVIGGRTRRATRVAERKSQEVVGTKKKRGRPAKVKAKISEKEILREAKALGLFKHNKRYGQYEIIVSVHEYKEL